MSIWMPVLRIVCNFSFIMSSISFPHKLTYSTIHEYFVFQECWTDVESFTRELDCLDVSKAFRGEKDVDNENYAYDAMNHHWYCVHSVPKTGSYIMFIINNWQIHFIFRNISPKWQEHNFQKWLVKIKTCVYLTGIGIFLTHLIRNELAFLKRGAYLKSFNI